MNNFIATFLSLVSFFAPSNLEGTTASVAPIHSISINNVTSIEMDILRDDNFKYFLTAYAIIEDNYKKAGTFNRVKMMIGALRGALLFGSGDVYADFILHDDFTGYCRSLFDGVRVESSGKIIEDMVVSWKPLKGRIAYIKISKFRYVAIKQFDNVVINLTKFKPRGLIIDLRDNGGGAMDIVQDMLYYLVDPSQSIHHVEEWQGNNYNVYPTECRGYRRENKLVSSKGFEFLRKVPIVVLMNKNTASISEVFIGALQDLRGAKLVGCKSYGKGIFQTFVFCKFGVMKMTSARWFAPRGASIHGKGFEPDYKIDDTRGKRGDNSSDAQLSKAKGVLRLRLVKKSNGGK